MMMAAPKRKPEVEPDRQYPGTSDASVVAQLAALRKMSVVELKQRWEILFGTPAPNNSRSYLEVRLGNRIKELEGKNTRKAIMTDPRKPIPGTRLLREWDGAEHSVTVLRDGFDWQGRKFKSLSAVARAITGTQWNGYRFFGLREAGRDPR
jgi:hypothetical protein